VLKEIFELFPEVTHILTLGVAAIIFFKNNYVTHLKNSHHILPCGHPQMLLDPSMFVVEIGDDGIGDEYTYDSSIMQFLSVATGFTFKKTIDVWEHRLQQMGRGLRSCSQEGRAEIN